MNILLFEQIILLFSISATISLFYFTLRTKNQRLHHTSFLFFLTGLIIWTGAICSSLFIENVFMHHTIFGGATVMLTGLFLFIKKYTDKKNSIYQSDKVIAGVGFIFLFISYWYGAIFESITLNPQGYFEVVNGPLAEFYGLFSLLYVMLPVILFARRRKHVAMPTAKNSIFFFVLIIFFIINVLTNSILPIFFGIFIFNVLGPVLLLFLAVTCYYAIIYNGFLDIKIVLQKGTVYILLLSLISIVYIFTLISISKIFGDSLIAPYLSAGITTLLGIMTVPHIDRYLRRTTNAWFFSDPYDYDVTIEQIYQDIQRNVSSESIISHTIDTLLRTLQVSHVTILSSRESQLYTKKFNDILTKSDINSSIPEAVYDKLLQHTKIFFSRTDSASVTNAWLTDHNYSIFVPIIFDEHMIGGIFLGSKKSGGPFYSKDVSLITQTSLLLSASIEKAYLFDAKKKQASILQKKIEERTREINTLQESQERLMMDIAHTLKTPLSVLYNEISTLSRTNPKVNITPLQSAIDETSKSISSMLRIARMESSSAQRPEEERVDMSALCELMLDHMSILADQKNISLTKSIEPDIYLNGVYEELEELLMTLLENALKYTVLSQGEKEVKLSIKKIDEKVILTLHDNGIGIAKEDLPYIFERFYRGTSLTTRKTQGSGIGLAICKTIVHNHKGTIAAESSENNWTEIKISLPCRL